MKILWEPDSQANVNADFSVLTFQKKNTTPPAETDSFLSTLLSLMLIKSDKCRRSPGVGGSDTKKPCNSHKSRVHRFRGKETWTFVYFWKQKYSFYRWEMRSKVSRRLAKPFRLPHSLSALFFQTPESIWHSATVYLQNTLVLQIVLILEGMTSNFELRR